MVRALCILIITLVAAQITTIAQTIYEVTSSKMTIAGTSNLHDWESNVTKVQASGDVTVEGNTLKSINNLTVTIPVSGIKSSKGSVMDRRTYSALKSDQHTNITYKLSKVTAIEKSGADYTLKTSGSLTVAGVAKTISMDVKGKVLSDGSLQFEGARKIKMTDHGIDPPTALMGTMKTGDEVTISFSVKMSRSNNSASAGK
ncbi:MAG TPA: YceI family protein [Saprospiraceae bacterium]|nr:YceI family protein [Saprospiraceae bacterium]HMP23376.1 YceI family protein [Saprospiraceae bacterium]